jgi:very-short-patch-repair endonuclease
MGRWQSAGLTEGFSVRPDKPAPSIKRAKRFRRALSKPEVLLWQILRASPNGHKFRRQHPAGPYVLDFFCARANLAVEIDGFAHDTGDRPERDARRDTWLAEHRIETLRIPAVDVLHHAMGVADSIVATVENRLSRFKKALPSPLRGATSPSQDDGEEVKVIV